MLASLCPAMAAIPTASARSGHPGRGRANSIRLPAVSWQHRLLDCGTLIVNGRRAGGGAHRAVGRTAGGLPPSARRLAFMPVG